MDKEIEIVTVKARADKAINSLKGILLGINLDRSIEDKELVELQSWCEKETSLIHKNPFKELINTISDAIRLRNVDAELVEDLLFLCQQYEGDFYFYNLVTVELQHLQGILHGLLADGNLNDTEIFELHNWLDKNEFLSTYYPYDELRSLVLSIVSDKRVTESERNILMAFMKQFVKISNTDIESELNSKLKNVSLYSLCTSTPNITFDGGKFCLTGEFELGPKSHVQSKIEDLGGSVFNSVVLELDYLIVGNNSSQAWAFSCYGRKIEKALDLRKKGKTVQIINELDFNDLLLDFKSGIN